MNTMRRAIAWLRGTFPLKREADYLAELSMVNERHAQIVRDMRVNHTREITQEREQIKSLMPRLIKVTARFTNEDFGGRFHVTTQITEAFVYEVLSNNAPHAIDYLGERMAYELVRQIRLIDFVHVRDAAKYDDQHHPRAGDFSTPYGRDFQL